MLENEDRAHKDERGADGVSDATGTGLMHIAIVGMAGRFPGADNTDEFWANLRQGVESISRFSEEEILASGVSHEMLSSPHYVRAGAVVNGVDLFDRELFGYYPREAEILDPQQRVFLECCWEAMENAGYGAEAYRGVTGVWAGSGPNTYLYGNLLANRTIVESVDRYHLIVASDKDFLATRVAYKLNLKGPSLAIQTACSSSLVAVHFACQALLNYQCEMALAGGVSIRTPQKSGYLYQEGGIASPDGHCRAFDAESRGTVPGNGAGVVVLKRLDDALRDGDTIRAVILGSAVNNDGSAKVGFTAPSVQGQATAIELAQSFAEVPVETIQYVEAHGTGTSLGDPIEIAALTQAFRMQSEARQFCAIGSVKTNIGHLDAAAGVTGLIKTALALEAKAMPPSLHYQTPNPNIDFASSPFYVNTKLTPWRRGEAPRRAGVSSFGLGGTNAHVICEEAPALSASKTSRPWQLLTLSARNAGALKASAERLSTYLNDSHQANLADAAYTLQLGRQQFSYRRALVCRDVADAAAALSDPARMLNSVEEKTNRPVAFLFSGQGSQYAGMGAMLYSNEPLFRQVVDECAEVLVPELGGDIREVIFAKDRAAGLLNETSWTQSALFVIEYALARQWMEWGIVPQALLGHSLGEYVAACLAGVFSLTDALRLVAARGRLMQSLPGGAMLSVSLDVGNLPSTLNGAVSIAAVNASNQIVLSGTNEAIEDWSKRFVDNGTACIRLKVSHAFHSAMMEPILGAFIGCFDSMELRAPALPIVSNLTGEWLTDEQATDPRYWAEHLRRTVRFADGVETILEIPDIALLEVGPSDTLASLARKHPSCGTDHPVIASLARRGAATDEAQSMATALAKLWLAGVPIDWKGYWQHERRRRIPLPTYPFQRQRYWIEPDPSTPALAAAGASQGPALYVPTWKRSGVTGGVSGGPAKWLVFSDGSTACSYVIDSLRSSGSQVVCVHTGPGFRQLADDAFEMNPARKEEYGLVFEKAGLPNRILHGWSLRRADAECGVRSVLSLVQALAGRAGSQAIGITVMTTGAVEVTGAETLSAQTAGLTGFCQVVSQEYPNLRSRLLDLEHGETGTQPARMCLEKIAAELAGEGTEPIVAWRGAHRWIRAFEPAPENHDRRIQLRRSGVYLITGALGRIGRTLSRHLAEATQARLILVTRLELPPRDEWDEAVGRSGRVSESIQHIRELERAGAEVVCLKADVADAWQVRETIKAARQRFGELHGVIHCAGFTGAGAIQAIAETKDSDFSKHNAPKLEAVRALAHALKDSRLDFCMVTSSLSSVMGGLGFAAYAAANASMDAAVIEAARSAAFPWIAVNWDGWRFDEGGDPIHGDFGLLPAKGVELFNRILASGCGPQVLASAGDFEARMAKWVYGKPAAPELASATGLHARPELPASFVAPRDKVEATIAGLWESVLGVEGIGVHDNFFDLGGHSLLATQLVTRLRDTFHTEFPLRRMFETPTVAGLAELVRTPTTASAGTVERIQRVDRNGPLPLSYAQQRLWILDRLQPGSPLYANIAPVRLIGCLDLPVLQRSLNEIVRRHEVLRTVFEDEGGRPVQRIQAAVELPVDVVDLRGLVELDQLVERQKCMARLTSFDLRKGPMMRLAVLREAEDSAVALLALHHIVSDGWSVAVLIRELAAVYEAFSRNEPSPLPELVVQYCDFAAWQRDWLTGGARSEQLAYWKNKLQGAPPLLELPTDKPRPAIQSFAGEVYRFILPRALVGRLEELSKSRGATLFMTLLAGLETLFLRYTGQTDILIGTPIANRTRAEAEALIGCFVNTLVIRGDLAGDPAFGELVERTRETMLEAYANQDLPFEALVEELQPERNLANTPFFQVMFVFQNMPVGTLELPGLKIEPIELHSGTEKFDQSWIAEECEQGVRIAISFSADLFEAATIERLAGHYVQLLEGAAADAGRRLSQLQMLSEAEYEHLTMRATQVPAEAVTFTRIFEQQVAATPEAPALLLDGESLSYGELNQRANRMQEFLRRRGVGPEVLVGLFLERSVDVVVSMLAIWKAGGAFVPLDVSYPAGRLAYMIEDSRLGIILTSRDLADSLPSGHATRIVLDSAWSEAEMYSLEDPVETPDLAAAAYVIYTSGSTGVPKGVVVPHGAIGRHISEISRHYGLTSADKVLQFSSLNFDAALEQVLAPLVAGAQVVMRGRELWAPSETIRVAERLGLTIVNFPPAYGHQLFEELARGEAGRAATVRLVILGGDAVRPETEALFHRSGLAATLLNAYGPTEATITATTFGVTADAPPIGGGSLPIGQSMGSRTSYIRDRAGNLAPIGVPGELFLGGDVLARGYLGQPALTADRFVPDSFGKVAGARLYRTGDLARLLPGGDLEFLGRLDEQVKIRGFRIELGEVESAMGSHPGVRQAAAAVRVDATGGNQLVGYFSSEPGLVLSARELKQHLRNALPGYMVPSVLVPIERMPLTPSGKLDRNALPTPTEEIENATAEGTGSSYPQIEEALMPVWGELLGTDRIGVHDNFFERGGHSLLATQLVSRVRDQFDVELSLRQLFQAPTLAGMAEMIGELLERGAGTEQLLAALEALDEGERERMLSGLKQ